MSNRYPEMVADFETTTTADDCRVWAWASATVDTQPVTTYGLDIGEFIEFCTTHSRHVYFHNLAFDGSFILDHIMKDGYGWVTEKPRPGQFTTLISLMGKFYQILVHWHNGTKTWFKDSLKKIPLSVSATAQAFQQPEPKGDLDYHVHRPPGYEPTDDEWDYIRRDVEIVAKALHVQRSRGMKKLTVGADALHEYKTVFGKKLFEKYFPVLDVDMDATARTAYRGGYTYADPRHVGHRTGPGQSFDVNSLYPYVMREKNLPYGMPSWFQGPPPDDVLFIVSVTFTATLKPGHLPMIQAKKSMFYSATEYLTVIDEPITLAVTNIDLALMQDHYDMDILCFNGGLTFRSVNGLFNDYIDKWSNVKNTSEGGTKLIAKLFLNSLYGKFATNPDVTGKRPHLDDDGVVRLRKSDPETRDPVYTPMGVFITSYARDITIRAAQQNYDTFAYADTDSLHLLTRDEPEGIEVDPHRLGAWKREYGFQSGVYLRAKQYGELKDYGDHEIHIAGAPSNIVSKMTLDDLEIDRVFHGKLVPERVPGGLVLKETTFTIQ